MNVSIFVSLNKYFIDTAGMVMITGKALTCNEMRDLLYNKSELSIDNETLERVDKSFRFLVEFSKDKIIYGINTGFGPMAQYKVDPADLTRLQYNLIRSHAAGSGEPLNPVQVKAAMIARLKTLSLGYSGIHQDAIIILKQLINNDITPLIPSHGGVGASGDLVQLSQLALVIIGEGEVFYKGEKRKTKEVFQELSIKPLKVHLREGLALINGTSVMTGIGFVNLFKAKNLLNWSLAASAMINELVQSFDDHFSDMLNQTKQHKGQQIIAAALRTFLSDSKLIRKREDHLYNGHHSEKVIKQKVQEYYSLRCVPQILGPVIDTLHYTRTILEGEINSVNDNPVINFETGTVYHGGNFHGDYVSFEMDKTKTAITKLSMLAERQLNFLLNNKLNEILPPFVNLGVLGLNLGMQGAQFTATSTVSENQSLSFPSYVHSIPNNNDNQDIVSMGTNSALIADKVINNTFEVLAIELMTLSQGFAKLGLEDKASANTQKILGMVRSILPVFKEDNSLYTQIAELTEYLKNNDLQFINL
jgi:histidine ammonia-lyase